VRLVAGFAVVFGLLAVLALLCRRRNARNTSPIRTSSLRFSFPAFLIKRSELAERKSARLHVLKRVTLTPTHQLHLISTDSASFLICTHPQGCFVLQQDTGRQERECGEGNHFLAELRRHAG
jgi:hypothetical protein